MVLQFGKSSPLWPELPFALSVSPFFTFPCETPMSFSQIQHKLHQISLSNMLLQKEQWQNAHIDKWRCNKVSSNKVYFTQAHFRKEEKTPHLLFHLYPSLCQINHLYYYPSVFQLQDQISNMNSLSNKRNKTPSNQWALSYHTTSGQLAKRNRRKAMIRLSLGKQSWSVKQIYKQNVVESISRNCVCHLVFHSLSTLIFANMILMSYVKWLLVSYFVAVWKIGTRRSWLKKQKLQCFCTQISASQPNLWNNSLLIYLLKGYKSCLRACLK